MIESNSRSVLDAPPSRGMTVVCASTSPRHCERSEAIHLATKNECRMGGAQRSHRLTTAIDGYRCAPPILRAVNSQQLRLLRRDRIVGADRAALDHLGIDPAIGVAEPALQRLGMARSRWAVSGSTLTAAQRTMRFTTLVSHRRSKASGRGGRIRARPASPRHRGWRGSEADGPARPPCSRWRGRWRD